ncbi:MAG: hypothetical protein Q8L89_03905 [Gammaproteobacteria bacterium]|nr:hypothetical protein [Gammaproteobacteria bacterium]
MTRAGSHLSLLYPGRMPPTAHRHKAPALHTLFARAKPSTCAVDRNHVLFELFAAESSRLSGLPIAAVTHAFDSANPAAAHASWWLRADPVVLRPDGDRLLMLGNHALDLGTEEAAALGTALHELFSAYGMAFSAPQPKRWYLQLESDPGLTLTGLEDAVAHDILHHLPQAGDAQTAARWRRLLNEVQMQLHASPVNQARLARGELPVNSVWFWGGGSAPAVAPHRFQQVWSEEPVSLGLACLSGAAYATVPENTTDWLHHVTQPGHRLLSPSFPAASASDDCAELFSNTWCAPLLGAVNSGALATLDIYTEDGRIFRNTPQTLRRWYDRFI